MKPTLIVIRHVDTEFNSDDKGAQRLRGHVALEPTREGKQQAKEMAETLKPVSIRIVYTSDLPQGVYGAKEIASANVDDPPVVKTEDLRSWDVGTFAGKAVKDVLQKLAAYQLKTPNEAPPGGEPFNARIRRWAALTQKCMRDAIEKPILGAIVFETHGRFLTWLCGWLDRGMKDPLDVGDVWEKSESPVENGDGLLLTYGGGKWSYDELEAGDEAPDFNPKRQMAAAASLRGDHAERH